MREIKPKQVWRRRVDGRTVHIMAVVENYVMYRIKGAMPNLLFYKRFIEQYDRWEVFEPKEASDG